ncbi:MAG: septum formation initiator [Rikenellaceae bacterium]
MAKKVAKNRLREHLLITITLVILVPIVVVIVKNLYHSYSISRQIGELKKESKLYQASIERDSLLLEKIKFDEGLEEFARETYFMQRKGERVFIVE